MSSPVSLNTPTVMFNEELENVRKAMKEATKLTLEKTSSQAKDFMKEKVDAIAKSSTPYITAPCKASVILTSPQSIEPTANTCITYSVEPVIESSLKKVGHQSVDKCVDTTAKKVIDQVVDSSVDSTKSYFGMAYDYILSWYSK